MGATGICPDDVETNPHLPSFAGTDGQTARGIALHQSYWSSMGSWRPEAWWLGFAVHVDGTLAGVQEIEAANPRGDHAEDMPRLRLTRQVWTTLHADHGVRIEGLAECRHLFGLP